MSTENKTCADLVEEKMMSRSEDIEKLMDIIEDVESDLDQVEEAIEELNNLPLEITEYRVVKVLLSTGGPADWLEIKLDDYGDIRSMTYHYQDWFDHAQCDVKDNTYLYEYGIKLIDTI